MGSATYGDFVVVSDFRGDVEVYRVGDRKMEEPLYETHDWEEAKKWAKAHSTKQPPRYVDYIGTRAD